MIAISYESKTRPGYYLIHLYADESQANDGEGYLPGSRKTYLGTKDFCSDCEEEDEGKDGGETCYGCIERVVQFRRELREWRGVQRFGAMEKRPSVNSGIQALVTDALVRIYKEGDVPEHGRIGVGYGFEGLMISDFIDGGVPDEAWLHLAAEMVRYLPYDVSAEELAKMAEDAKRKAEEERIAKERPRILVIEATKSPLWVVSTYDPQLSVEMRRQAVQEGTTVQRFPKGTREDRVRKFIANKVTAAKLSPDTREIRVSMGRERRTYHFPGWKEERA